MTSVAPPEIEDFLRIALERYELGKEADSIDLAEAEDDNKFAYAEDKTLGQWDDKAKKARKKRPTIQWNRIPTYVQQVVNDGRQNKPAIKIAPLDGGTQETADFFQSRIRHIEYETNADTAKDTAREQQVTTGRGFIRVCLEYIPGTMQQRICIDPIGNQFSVCIDPNAKKYDCSDADWMFLISYISKEEHEREYGSDSVVSQLDFASLGRSNPAPNWIGVGKDGRQIQIAEYWLKKYQPMTLYGLNLPGDPAPVAKWEDEITEDERRFITSQRDTVKERYKVMQYVINGAEILKETEWIGSTIPIVPVWGKQAVVDGVARTFSLIRNAKSPQKLVNLFVSNIVEKLGQMAKTPYKIPLGGLAEQWVKDWQNVNNTEYGFLYYNSRDEAGNPLPPPERVDYEPPIQGMVQGLQFSIDAIKAAMGIYDAAMGAKSNETSGKAINARQKESDISNYHFPDNEARSNKYLGEILVELIPLVDKQGSTVPVRSIDGKTNLVPVGVPHKDPKSGQMVTHDLMNGRYGVSVETGPTYTSARKEENDKLGNLIQAAPDLMMVFGDQFLATGDTPNAQEMADRMKRFINMKNPGLIQDQQSDPAQQAQQLQAENQQLKQQLQQAMGHGQQLFDELEGKKAELSVKERQIESDAAMKKYVVDQQELTKRTIALETLNQEQALAKLEQELGLVRANLQIMADAQGKVADQEHAKEMKAGDQAHQAGMAQMANQHQGSMASQQMAHEDTSAEAAAERESQAQETSENAK